MKERSKELLELEHKNTPLSSLESALVVCDRRGSITQTQKRPPNGSPLTAPVPPSQLLGKVKDFLGVMSEAYKRLEIDAKDNPKNYDIEELTGYESEVIETDLMLGVADLHTPEAVAAAESAISSCHRVIPLAADGSETDSDESSADDENRDDDGHDDCHDNDANVKEDKIQKKQSIDLFPTDIGNFKSITNEEIGKFNIPINSLSETVSNK